jgi:hypothetical protein
MRFLLLFSLSGLTALLLGPFLPYWGLMLLMGIFAAFVGGTGTGAFFSAALAVGIVWLLIPLRITRNTGSNLPEMIGQLMDINHSFMLLLATSLIGFLIGGFGALTGNRFRKLIEKERTIY